MPRPDVRAWSRNDTGLAAFCVRGAGEKSAAFEAVVAAVCDEQSAGRVVTQLRVVSPCVQPCAGFRTEQWLRSKFVIHTMLHSCLDAAVREKLLLRNPVHDCKPPKLEKKEMKTLSQEQMQAYLRTADERGLLPMFFLELTTGLRKSELVALLWSDVDLQQRTLSVSKQAYKVDGKMTVVPPKTGNSVRKLALSEETIRLLKQQRLAHPDSPYLFPSPVTGEMYHPDSVVKLHQKILKQAGLEHIRFHDLRHTFATLALQNGVDVKTVSAMLGHSSAGFTLATYTHTTTAAQHKAAEIMGSLASAGIA